MAKSKPTSRPSASPEPELLNVIGKFLREDPLSLLLAILISVIVILRPWRDGLTYVGLNTYFVAVALVVGAVALFRWFRQGRLQIQVPLTLLLVTYVAIGWTMSRAGVDQEASNRVFLNWCLYAFLFFAVSSQLQSRQSLRYITGMLVVAGGVAALWAVLHRNVQLPLMRQQIHDMPHLLRAFFNSDVLTPELQDRLESNRAFGSFLFPNVLAAFLILFIPFLVSMSAIAVQDLRKHLSSGNGNTSAEREERFPVALLLGGVGSAALVFVVIRILNAEAWRALTLRDESWVEGIGGLTLLYGVIPLAIGTVGCGIWYLRGQEAYGAALRSVVCSVSSFFAIYGLLVTYSRGAMLALFLACVVAVFVFYSTRFWMQSLVRRGVVAAGVFFIMVSAATSGNSQVEEMKDWPYEYEKVTQYQTGQAGIEGNVAPKDPSELNLEGQEFTGKDLSSTKSLRLRFTYWEVSLKMALDNWMTGVGWGAFGVSYQEYQFLGAGDVKQAHNDYLQAFAETGILGYLAFSAFWVMFFIWGAQTIISVTSSHARWRLLGLYMGLLACAIHSLVDFNFSNPSLATFAFVMAGLFIALSRDALSSDGEETLELRLSPSVQRVIAGAAAIVLLLAAMLQTQMFIFDYERAHGTQKKRLWTIGEDNIYKARYDVAFKLLAGMYGEANARKDNPNWKPNVNLTNLSYLFPDVGQATAFGWFGELITTTEPAHVVPLQPGDAFPTNTLLMIERRDMNRARPYIQNAVRDVIETLEKQDEIYPHSHQHAHHIAQLYGLLLSSIDRRDAPPRKEDIPLLRPLSHAMTSWADKAIERGPTISHYYSLKAEALWRAARHSDDNVQLSLYREGLEYHEKAHELAPVNFQILGILGEKERQLGGNLAQVPQFKAEGERLLREGNVHLQKARLIRQYRQMFTAESTREK